MVVSLSPCPMHTHSGLSRENGQAGARLDAETACAATPITSRNKKETQIGRKIPHTQNNDALPVHGTHLYSSS